uniref:Uncharacterized protein n=1 Tax=Kalanchoe fedtschenkoi TaxID=63787 RepID=A0A7N0ZSP4_KALFE
MEEKKEDVEKSRGEDERREAAIASAAPLQPTFKPLGVSPRQISVFQELHKRRLLIKKQSKKYDKSQEKKGKCPLKTPASRNFLAANFRKSSVDEECVNETPLHSDNESVHHVSKKQRQKLYWGLGTKERWEMKANM